VRRKAAGPAPAEDPGEPAVEDAEAEADTEGGDAYDRTSAVALEDAGFPLGPARTYRVTVGRDARAVDGQTLGYTWMGQVENWHQRAFSSFGSGHGVWEAAGGGELPFQ